MRGISSSACRRSCATVSLASSSPWGETRDALTAAEVSILRIAMVTSPWVWGTVNTTHENQWLPTVPHVL